MHIRPEAPGDAAAIRKLTIAAFGETSVALLVDLIRDSPNLVPELSLVATDDGRVIGHVLLSRVALVGDAPRSILSLAPLSVHSDHQGRGVGAALVAAAWRQRRPWGKTSSSSKDIRGTTPASASHRRGPRGSASPTRECRTTH